jgi:hypothetical protein
MRSACFIRPKDTRLRLVSLYLIKQSAAHVLNSTYNTTSMYFAKLYSFSVSLHYNENPGFRVETSLRKPQKNQWNPNPNFLIFFENLTF